MRNPQWFSQTTARPTPQRLQLHAQIRAELRDSFAHVPQAGKAVILAGPPGAGKTTLRASLGITEREWAVVDADVFKERLLREAVADGSYTTWIKPHEVSEREREGERFFPLEHAALVHEESSMLAARVRTQAIKDKTNVVVDTVLSNEKKARELGRQLASGGYEVQVLDVEVPIDVSRARMIARHEAGYRKGLTSTSAEELGGRAVPSEVIEAVFAAGVNGRSAAQANATMLLKEFNNVTDFRRFHPDASAGSVSQAPSPETLAYRLTVGGEIRLGTKPIRREPLHGLPPSPPEKGASKDSDLGIGD